MLVIRGVPERAAQPAVLTIGNFDGVHRGHRALLGRMVDKASELGLPAVVLTFEPHPREFFAPESAPPRLSDLRDKALRLAECGVDRMVVCRFNRSLAGLSAQAFVDRILVSGLAVRHLFIGDDFRFGRGRGGDLAFLQQAGQGAGFAVESLHTVSVEDERVSSSAVRAALAADELDHAARLLGRPYSISGRVAHGDKIGRQLGFATANIRLRHVPPPLRGIFAVSVEGAGPLALPAVASLGVRPTVTDSGRFLLETHIFDFDGDLYGRRIQVNFHRKLRNEARYDSLDALTAQIAQDARDARAFFAAAPGVALD